MSDKHDPLTGLLHRASAIEHLERWNASGEGFCLALLDLDRFKCLNDQHGMMVGDAVLTHVGAQIRKTLPEGDLAARYGGEEFLLLLATDDLEVAQARVEQLRAALRDPVPGTDGVTIRFSAGLVRRSVAELVRSADEALFQAKRDGRDRTVTR